MITEKTWNRIEAFTKANANANAKHTSGKTDSGGGEVSFFAKLGAFADPWYSWTQVLPDGSGGWTSTSIKGDYAVEANGAEDTPEDDIVRLYCIGPDSSGNLLYAFEWCACGCFLFQDDLNDQDNWEAPVSGTWDQGSGKITSDDNGRIWSSVEIDQSVYPKLDYFISWDIADAATPADYIGNGFKLLLSGDSSGDTGHYVEWIITDAEQAGFYISLTQEVKLYGSDDVQIGQTYNRNGTWVGAGSGYNRICVWSENRSDERVVSFTGTALSSPAYGHLTLGIIDKADFEGANVGIEAINANGCTWGVTRIWIQRATTPCQPCTDDCEHCYNDQIPTAIKVVVAGVIAEDPIDCHYCECFDQTYYFDQWMDDDNNADWLPGCYWHHRDDLICQYGIGAYSTYFSVYITKVETHYWLKAYIGYPYGGASYIAGWKADLGEDKPHCDEFENVELTFDEDAVTNNGDDIHCDYTNSTLTVSASETATDFDWFILCPDEGCDPSLGDTLKVTLSGIVDDGCSDCTDLNDTYYPDKISEGLNTLAANDGTEAEWQYAFDPEICGVAYLSIKVTTDGDAIAIRFELQNSLHAACVVATASPADCDTLDWIFPIYGSPGAFIGTCGCGWTGAQLRVEEVVV